MFKKVIRELYMLPRGEQRAIVLLSLLLIVSAGARIAVRHLPPREPPGLEEFMRESKMLLAAVSEADSLRREGAPYAVVQPTMSRPIDINRADSLGLLPLPGIGPVFASRIVRYRELLGGYVSFEQFKEVYGLSAETVGLLRGRIFIDTSLVRKINLDSVTFRELLRHPYFQIEQVRELMQFRDLMGPIKSLETLVINNLIPDSTLERVLPYLEWSH
jgi:DNA uptake protein ComE-like DNA-binding protein